MGRMQTLYEVSVKHNTLNPDVADDRIFKDPIVINDDDDDDNADHIKSKTTTTTPTRIEPASTWWLTGSALHTAGRKRPGPARSHAEGTKALAKERAFIFGKTFSSKPSAHPHAPWLCVKWD